MEDKIPCNKQEEVKTENWNMIKKERRGCLPLKLRAIPYIGKLPLDVMPPVTIMKPITKTCIKEVPQKVKAAIGEFLKKYPEGDIDTFVINSCGETFKEKISTNEIQLHYIVHPYGLRNYTAGQDEKAEVYMSIYRLNSIDPIYSAEGGIEIDSDNLLGESCLRVIRLSDSDGSIKINSDGFLFNISCHIPVLCFFGLSVHLCPKERPKLLICLYFYL